MTTKGLKIGRPKSLPCPCCGMPVLTRPALQLLVAAYASTVHRGYDVTLQEASRVSGASVRGLRRVLVEFPYLFKSTGMVGQQKTWALTGDGYEAVSRLLLEDKKEGAA